jgi:tRNA (adenine37-N6)-methyltransferase
MPPESVTFHPIGIIRTPFTEKVAAPRQPYAAGGARGTIELLPGRDFEHALSDLGTWDHIWVLFWFHLNTSWRPKVLPPRSTRRRGVFATRSPHRPNAIGMSVLRLEAVRGLTLDVRGVDMIDGTPVLDIKPYLPFADAVPDAGSGWVGAQGKDDPAPFEVVWAPRANDEAAWLEEAHGIDLRSAVTRALALGPEPHPYRRIRKHEQGFCLAVKEWRAYFRIEGRTVQVDRLRTGYRDKELAGSKDAALLAHRAFVARFG